MPKIFDAIDFSGGYATDLAPEVMPDNMVLKAENLWWKNGLVGRGGTTAWAAISGNSTNPNGIFRGYLNSVWYTFYANRYSTYGKFYYTTLGAAFTTLVTTAAATATVLGTTASAYHFDQLGSEIAVVNGSDRPQVIFYSTANSRIEMTSMDRYDQRTISTFDWYAGWRYTTGTTQYVQRTSEAQSTVASDFYMTPTTNTSDGHIIIADYPFTRVVYTSASQMSTHASTAVYNYWNGAWTAFTPELYPTWTTSTGGSTAIVDKTLEIPYLSDWTPINTTALTTEGTTWAENKYAVRVTWPTAPSTVPSCQKLTVYDIHYLTRIMADERPSLVRTHNNRLYLASGNNIQISPYNSVKGWDEYNVEYFEDGGNKIEAMLSMEDYLLLMKSGALYGFFTNDWNNLTKRLLSNIGIAYANTASVVNQKAFFLAHDGVRMWTGAENVLVSKHIQTDVGGYTKTVEPAAVGYKGYYWISFPSTNVTLVADPDSFRRDDAGDGRLSWFKFTGTYMGVENWSWYNGAGDLGYLVGHNTTGTELRRYDNANGMDETATAFTKTFKSKYYSHGKPGEYKIVRRIKPDVQGAGTWVVTMSVDNGTNYGSTYVTTDIPTTITSTHAYHFTTDLSVPYVMDGKNLAIEIATASTNAVKIFGFSKDVEVRRW